MANKTITAPRVLADSLVRLLTTQEAAEVLSMGTRTVQEKVEARELACVKIGRSVRFHPDDLAEFIERNRRKAIGWKGGTSK